MINNVKLLKTIYSYCLDCCGRSPDLVAECQASPDTKYGLPCAVWKYRMGATIENLIIDDSEILQAIKKRCLECVEDIEEVKHCSCSPNSEQFYSCPLWIYRFGTKPKLYIAGRKREDI